MHFCSKFGNYNFNWWWVMACTSSKWGKFWLWSSIWPWRSQSIIPQNNRSLNQGLLYLWSKFGDPSLNGWWVIVRTNLWLTDTRTHTHIQATTIPEGQNWPRVKMMYAYHFNNIIIMPSLMIHMQTSLCQWKNSQCSDKTIRDHTQKCSPYHHLVFCCHLARKQRAMTKVANL